MKIHQNTLWAVGMLALSALFWASPVAHAYCGDGVLETANGEQCDDRNFNSGDGCTSYCSLEDKTMPEVASVSIANLEVGVPTDTTSLRITFSEAIDPLSVISTTVFVDYQAKPLEATLSLNEDKTQVTLAFKTILFSEATHALHVKSVRDLHGNVMQKEFISTFTTAAHVDKTPPLVVADPPAGEYNFAQDVWLTAYLSQEQSGPGFKEEGVIIYYTVNGDYPTDKSPIFKESFTISNPTTLKFFGVDKNGNRSQVWTQTYRFGCPERPYAKTITPYPTCKVEECERGFLLINNSCVVTLDGTSNDPDAYKTDAVTAPLFGSSTPIIISSKPAIYVSPQHQGVIPRPVIFKNLSRNSEVRFKQNTLIKNAAGNLFVGYLFPPENRYIKEFPINFGYSFKSIVEFKSDEGEKLSFTPAYEVVIPFLEGDFKTREDVTVFTFDPTTEQYQKIDSGRVSLNLENLQVTVTAGEPGIFFLAGKGESFTEAEFRDMENHWAKNYAEALFRRGIVKGRSKGIYAPDEPLNRAEFAKIAIESIGAATEPLNEIEDSPFPDVHLDAWYTPYIKKAKELGLIQGYPDGLFRPEQTVNRAEAIKIMVLAFKFKVEEAADFKSQTEFPDIETGTWYYPMVNFAVKFRLLDGVRTPNGTILSDFSPGRAMTRGEMAKLALKSLELFEAE